MKHSKFLIPAVAAFFAVVLTSCGNVTSNSDSTNSSSDSSSTSGSTSSTGQDELYICVYDGGYGTEWLQQMASDYQKKTGVVVHAEASTSILDRLEDQLENGADYDIYMSHDINWQNFAARDLLANLDDLYTKEIDNKGTTFEQRVASGASELSVAENGKGDEHHYKVCYTQGAGGFLYNIDMFNKNGWTIPTTYQELTALCSTIVSAQIEIPGSRKTVVPFAWSGSDRQYYWDYPVFEWWAQLAGLDKIEKIKQYKGDDGSYSKGYEMYNPATNYKEFLQAYDMWYNLIAKNAAYSAEGAYGAKLATAQAQFANGEAAMIPYAQWGKYEIESATAGDLSFDIAMMKTPKATSSSIDVNYQVGFGDSIIVPNNIKDHSKELAKNFIAYMSTPEACRTFAEKSQGAFLAFDYSNVDLSEIEATDTFIKSVHEKLTDTTCFNLVSTNPITYWNVNKVMPWIENTYYYTSACSKPAENTSSIIGNIIYGKAQTGWNVWLRNAGLSD